MLAWHLNFFDSLMQLSSLLTTSWIRHVSVYLKIQSFSKRKGLRLQISKSCAWIEWLTFMRMKVKSILISSLLLLIITDSIIVFDLDDTQEKKCSLSFNADFESLSSKGVIRGFRSTTLGSMQKKCFEIYLRVCALRLFGCLSAVGFTVISESNSDQTLSRKIYKTGRFFNVRSCLQFNKLWFGRAIKHDWGSERFCREVSSTKRDEERARIQDDLAR